MSDAWTPQVNGVVRTLATVATELAAMGHAVEVIGPDRFRTIPCPTYPEIRLALAPGRRLARMIAAFAPDHLHIATEGPLGLAARAWARRRRAHFTTSFHTRFAEYLAARTRLPAGLFYPPLRRFHAAADATLVATPSLMDDLAARGFARLAPWTRGVDLDAFRPGGADMWAGLPRPVFAYVGRVAVEKNIAAFLRLDLPGSKVVVGGGPQLAALRAAYPGAVYTGPRFGTDLAASYASADVLVFPSRTDTFGLVLLESLACGTPFAAYDVTGPKDILATAPEPVGAVGDDLRAAALRALTIRREACRAHAERYEWRACALRFVEALVPLDGLPADAAAPISAA
ncbi:glycosyltransferase family 4 protein [Acidisphaera rubrifaciens]|uniref:Glycosyl transferase n=1 Tax=Acidisphaera rubrifaciens HS-AP3 TaxID=1231350 RepID=A0A0D6P8R2_9PROT|nr:glycosyltransferase family 1 protein [Acidisphaera rubrifaciens]GAN77244.1 glycosyl transferase [Acidisphaera rubrifaciens HS-AP3]